MDFVMDFDKIQMDFVLKIEKKELWVTLTLRYPAAFTSSVCAQSLIDKMLKNDTFFLTYFWSYDSLFGWCWECKRIS